MKINKVYLIITTILLLLSCKKETKKNTFSSNAESEKTESDNNCLNNRTNTTIVHSCGGGCAVSYTEKNISVVDSLIKVEFDGTSYINEKIEEEFKGNFYINCGNGNKATHVFFENEYKENLLNNNVNSISSSFQIYSDELCSCLKKDKKNEQLGQVPQKRVDRASKEEYTCEKIEVTNTYEEPLYKVCDCIYDFTKCYSLFYENIDNGYKEFLPQKLPTNDTIFFHKNSKIEFKFNNNNVLKIALIEEGAEEFLFKSKSGGTIIEFYEYPP
ncbi:hypothetical protein [Cellulophaga baltica]|uniref:hypothetical protein n=1 Tax=Cellulophaga baltica TaxID=76594 RepID=UPI002493F94A|nr:hypothetical protein [Cellulophaga baltica]